MTKSNKEVTAIDKIVGNRIKEARIYLGLSREQLAKESGVTQQQVLKYEMAHNRISASRLHSLARLLNKPLEYFFDGKTDENVNANNRMCLEAARNFRLIKSSGLKRKLSGVIKEVAEKE